MEKPTQSRPGDFLLDRYFPGAKGEAREEARAQIKRFVRALVRVATRLAHEERVGADSPKSGRRRRIPTIP